MKNNTISTSLSGKSAIYENEETYIQASNIYSYGNTAFHVGNLLVIGKPDYVFAENVTGSYVIETLKNPDAIIKNVIIVSRSAYQCTNGFNLYYLDKNDTYKKFYTGTLNQGAIKIVVPIPSNVETNSIKLENTSYYHMGPGLQEFHFEYEIKEPEILPTLPSQKVKESVKNTILNNELIQKVLPKIEIK